MSYIEPETGAEFKRTGSGTETFKILRTKTGTETFVLINKVLEMNKNFLIKKVLLGTKIK